MAVGSSITTDNIPLPFNLFAAGQRGRLSPPFLLMALRGVQNFSSLCCTWEGRDPIQGAIPVGLLPAGSLPT